MSAVRSSFSQVVQREHQHAEHPVGAVDEREALLLDERERLDAGGSQGVGGRHHLRAGLLSRRAGLLSLSKHTDIPLAHRRERDVRERREVTGASE